MTEWIISTSVLILIVVALRYILRGKMNLRLQYALWALVLLRALVPLSFFSSPISVMNAVDRIDSTKLVVEDFSDVPSVEHIEFVPDINNNPTDNITTGNIVGYYPGDSDRQFPTVIAPNVTVHEYETVQKAMEAQDVLRIVWICGAVLMALVFLCTNLRFGFRLRHCRKELELQGNILPVYICPGIETPCLFGFFRPAVYLTPGCENDQSALRHVLAHEFTHYRHGDNIWSILRCVAVALHWYNPLVWLAAFLSMRDAELACDEGAIKRLGENERSNYGRTLIGMTCRSGNVRALALTATTMTGSKKGIKERIILIAKRPKMAIYTLIAVLLVAAIAVGCTFSGAEEDKADTDGFTPDYMNINNILSSVICDPVSDPAIVQEFYELYLSFETGKEVEKEGGNELILGFGSDESEEFEGCIITSDGLVGRFENNKYVYYELENGEEIYDKISAQYKKMQLDTLFSPTEVYISRSGLEKELVITDPLDCNELYVNFKVCSANATEIDESKVNKDDPINVTFTDGEITHEAILYSDGCYSPEPEQWETERKYYRLGSYDNCGTQGIYMLFDTYCNMAGAKYVRDYVPMIVITDCAEDYDTSGGSTATVEYYNALYDRPHTANTNAVSATAAMWLLSQKGRFETVFLLNATDNTKRAEWLAEDLKLIADNVITDPAEIESKTGWTVVVEKQEGIPLENGLMLRIDNSISKYEDKALLSAASFYIQQRIDQLNESHIEITDAYLTALTEIPCGAIGGNSGVGSRIFLMEYRLKPKSLNGFFSNDVIAEGEWITQETSKGQPYLILHCDGTGYSGLSIMITEYDLQTTYSTPEMMEKYFNDPYTAACMEAFKLNLIEPSPLSISPPENYEDFPIEVYSMAESLVWSDIRFFNDLGSSNRFLMGTFQIADAEITKLEQVNTGTAGLNDAVNMYRLEYRLLPDNADAVPDIIGINLENDWLVGGSYGTMYLLFYVHWDDDSISYDHMVSMSEETLQQYNTKAFIEKYDNMYTAACMETLHRWRGAFYYDGAAQEVVEYYAENVYPYEHYMGGAPVGDDPAAITDFKPVSNQLIAVSVTGDKLVGHMSTAVVPLQFEGNPYWGASNGQWGEDEYEGMLIIESFFELEYIGENRWVCTELGTGGFGGWGYIPMDFENSEAVLATLELWLGDMEGYEENILTILPLIDWSALERSSYDIDLGDLFKAIAHAAIGDDGYYTDTYPDDQLYRDLYVMKARFNTDGAYSEFLSDILLRQYEHDTATFEAALKYFSIEQQDRILDAVAFAKG